MGIILNRRRNMGSKLPYDAEIEYLETNGYQCIDTGIAASDKIEAKIVYAPTSSSDLSTGLFSARNTTYSQGASAPYFTLSIWINSNNVALNDKGYDSTYLTYRYDLSSRYTFEIRERKLYVNNVFIVASTSTDNYEYTVTYGLLRGNALLGFDIRRGLPGKLYSALIKKNGVVLRDFIPVRVGQVGYMYDKVSGQLFGNAGTGDFILGPEV